MKLAILTLLSGFAFAAPALACEKFLRIDPVQMKADFETLRSDDADPVDRIIAFSTLACSDQIAIRERAVMAGLHASPEIQAEALYTKLASNNAVTIRLLDEAGLSDAHYDVIRSAPMKAYSVKFRDPARSCISIHSDRECDGNYHFSVNGRTVQFSYTDAHGVFTLGDTGLTGEVTYVIDRTPLTFPARIELQ